MMTITDAIRLQPKLADEPGYKRWVEQDDWDALDEALGRWGFAPTDENGETE